MSWTQQDTSFKKLQSKRITTSTGKGINEEKGASTLELYLPDIKTELIPGTPPGASTSVLAYTGGIGQTLAVDTSVPSNLTWFATTGFGNTTVANDGTQSSEEARLMNWISDKYDAFGTISGAGYEVKLYDKNSNLITKTDPSDWLFDYQTGILTFNNASTAYGTVATSGPYRIVGYRYIGSKGIISASYGGLGYTTYTKGDLLVGAGSTFIKLNVGSNNYVLIADSSTSSGLNWVVNSGSGAGVSVINGLSATTQFFAVGSSGTAFNISSVGSTHTFNIPIAGTGSTGLITNLAQTIAGSKTFTSAIIGDLSGTATTSTYAYQSGYAITSGLATTSSNLNLVNVSSGTFYPILSNTSSSVNGIGASVNSFFSFNASTGSFGATSVNILAGQSYSIDSNSVLSATSLGTGVTNSSLTAIGTITTGTWAGTLITSRYGGTGYNSYSKGDILVGAGSTFIKVGSGSTNYILSSNSIFPSGVGWTWVSAVGIGTNPPYDTHDSDLWWNSNDGSLNFYYNDGDTSQWVEIAGGSGIDLSQPVHITSGLASTTTSTGALIVDGGVGVAGTVYASSFSINGVYDQISSTLITSNTNTNQVAMSIDASSFRTAKMFVQVTSGSNYHSQEILMVHDNSQVYMTEYAMVNTGAIGSTFDGDISGGNMRFLVTPTNAVTTYKIACSAMRI